MVESIYIYSVYTRDHRLPGNHHQIQDLRYKYLNSKHGKPRSPRMGIYTYLNVFPPKRSLSTLAQSESSIPWNGR